MAKIPQQTRLNAEEFTGQSSWIGQLINPLNTFVQQVLSALNKRLTITDNFAGTFKTVEINGTFPINLMWEFQQRPTSVIVCNVYRTDQAAFTQIYPVQVQWQFTQSGQLSILAAPGLLPPPVLFLNAAVNTSTYKITLPAHQLATGLQVKATVTSGGTLPTGLTAGSNYYVIVVDSNTIQLASSYNNALTNTAVALTAVTGSGTNILTPGIFSTYQLVLECKVN